MLCVHTSIQTRVPRQPFSQSTLLIKKLGFPAFLVVAVEEEVDGKIRRRRRLEEEEGAEHRQKKKEGEEEQEQERFLRT